MSSPMPRSRLGPLEQLWSPATTALPYVTLAFCIALMPAPKPELGHALQMMKWLQGFD